MNLDMIKKLAAVLVILLSALLSQGVVVETGTAGKALAAAIAILTALVVPSPLPPKK